jgi:hypothetical protein
MATTITAAAVLPPDSNNDDKKEPMIQSTELDEDPLLIAQTLTYVTDDGSVSLSFECAPFSLGKFVVVALLMAVREFYVETYHCTMMLRK